MYHTMIVRFKALREFQHVAFLMLTLYASNVLAEALGTCRAPLRQFSIRIITMFCVVHGRSGSTRDYIRPRAVRVVKLKSGHSRGPRGTPPSHAFTSRPVPHRYGGSLPSYVSSYMQVV